MLIVLIKVKLSEANELQLFLKAVEQVAIWISLAEALIAS